MSAVPIRSEYRPYRPGSGGVSPSTFVVAVARTARATPPYRRVYVRASIFSSAAWHGPCTSARPCPLLSRRRVITTTIANRGGTSFGPPSPHPLRGAGRSENAPLLFRFPLAMLSCRPVSAWLYLRFPWVALMCEVLHLVFPDIFRTIVKAVLTTAVIVGVIVLACGCSGAASLSWQFELPQLVALPAAPAVATSVPGSTPP